MLFHPPITASLFAMPYESNGCKPHWGDCPIDGNLKIWDAICGVQTFAHQEEAESWGTVPSAVYAKSVS